MSNKSLAYAHNLKFVVCDLEFSLQPEGDWLLSTGAMVNTLSRYPPLKLQGKPIVIPKIGKVEEYHLSEAMSNTAQGSVPTLSTLRITKYLFGDRKNPVVVFWNASTDKYLLEKLDIKGVIKFLDITTVECRNTNTYELVLRDMNRNNQTIFSTNIGFVEKPTGGTLNLFECHSAICDTDHDNITRCHDPVTNVIYTRCIFARIIREFKPSKIYAYCSGRPEKDRRRNRAVWKRAIGQCP